MLDIRHVLYPTDFSEASAAALPLAVRIAREHGADLHALHALVLHAADEAQADRLFPTLEESYRELESWAGERMSAHLEAHQAPEVTLHEAKARGFAAPAVILEYAEEHDIDLIVMGTHGRRGLRHLLLGSVAEEVVRRAPCPVITVRRAPGLDGRRWPSRIVVPLDFSENSELALAYAAELAGRTGAAIDIVHVVEPAAVPDPYVMGGPGLAFDLQATRERVTETLEERAGELLGESASFEVHVEVGRSAPGIAEFASARDADLIVMTSHGHSGLDRVLLGSVAEGVVRRASVPLMIVKPFGENLLVEDDSRDT
ncbi:MAG TPA: universal stress protein [Gemmatimonadota bacterium]|nr:universal stress protein [Gemmatimonadota bacterium]